VVALKTNGAPQNRHLRDTHSRRGESGRRERHDRSAERSRARGDGLRHALRLAGLGLRPGGLRGEQDGGHQRAGQLPLAEATAGGLKSEGDLGALARAGATAV